MGFDLSAEKRRALVGALEALDFAVELLQRAADHEGDAVALKQRASDAKIMVQWAQGQLAITLGELLAGHNESAS